MTDYISREAAFKEFAEFVRDSNNSDFVDAPTWNDAVSLIGSLPAADVVEVVHGQWIEFDHSYLPPYQGIPMIRCNKCGYERGDHARTPKKYCPSCGAKMDKADTVPGGDGDG